MAFYDRFDFNTSSILHILLELLRIVAAGLGIAAIVIGLICAVMLFNTIYSGLQNPAQFNATFEQWSAVVGGEVLGHSSDGGKYALARVLTVVMIGGGVFLLVWIAMGFIVNGAKVVSLTASDARAVKRILQYAFGSSGAPDEE